MIGLIELLLLAAAAAAGVVWAIRIKRTPAAAAGAEPHCGRCNYIVRGVPSFTCPECGSDLREVGILTSRVIRPVGPGSFIAMWTLLLLLLAIPLTFLVRTLPLWRNYTMQRFVFVQEPKLNTTLLVSGTRTGFGLPTKAAYKPDTLTLHLQTGSPRSDLVVDPATGGYQFTDSKGAFISRPTGYGPNVVRDWLVATIPAASAADPALVLARATDIDTCANEMGTPSGGNFTRVGRDATHPVDPVTAHPTWTLSNPAPANWIVVYAAWVALWLSGVLRIRHRFAPLPSAPERATNSVAVTWG
jgi:hypothetical protein